MNILEQRAIRSKRVSYELVPLYRGDGYSEAVYARRGRALRPRRPKPGRAVR